MKIAIDTVNDSESNSLPGTAQIQQWIESSLAALSDLKPPLGNKSWELSIRFVNTSEIQRLNQEYRKKDAPTNVLSFPSHLPESVLIQLEEAPLGDIVICPEIVESEATEQNKSQQAHWAHLLIHGFLHLQGYDHEGDEEASEMENLEISIMKTLGFPDPYLIG